MIDIKPCKRCGRMPVIEKRVEKISTFKKLIYWHIECPSGCGGTYSEENFMNRIGGINRLIRDWNRGFGGDMDD